MKNETLSVLRAFAVNALIPPICPLCQRSISAPGLCAGCFTKLSLVTPPACRQCALPFDHDQGNPICGACLAKPPAFDRATAALRYDDTARQLILALKHGDRLDIAPLLARIIQPRCDDLAEADLVIPIPLHRWRFFRRRFNQSAEIARHLLVEAGLPQTIMQPDVLIRHRNTPSQGRKTRHQRSLNMRGAFRVNPARSSALQQARVLLVDDVMTTGSTLDAAARVLKRHGAVSVAAVVAARVC